MVDFESDLLNCIAALQAGDTILYPTETVWGLGCNALDENAVEKVFALKQRPKEKSLIVLLAEPKDILQFVAAPPPDIIDIVSQFDCPTTVVYDHALGFPDNVANADGSIALRITTDPFCKALIKRFRKPLVSTSANLSGESTPASFAQIHPSIVENVGYAVAYRRNEQSPSRPSRLIKINDDGSFVVLRS
ncbi:MAG: L-threonylcarbamoyladenylate synthase [Bacteroidetes bacterium]|nr:L-threonylcarbamoyladenylate synthase [Bacteroidota bacterium]MBS1740531.1 L-threonylcarbamoyladenylate synthase [Bacteroidota bacterium]MBS1774841.1 L-threonylcarbamoyladenylate synthase [Bacteroidota bacterium]